MSESPNDPSIPPVPAYGEQPLYTTVSSAAPPPPQSPQPPPPDGPGPKYVAPYPPYPYETPQAGGLSPNVAAGLAYFTIIPAVLFLLLEPYKRMPLVRFHSWQSIFLFIASVAVRSVEGMLGAMLPSFLAYTIGSLLSLVLFIGWLVAVIKAFQGATYQLPLIGPFAESTAASTSSK